MYCVRSEGIGCSVGHEVETYLLAKAIGIFLGERRRCARSVCEVRRIGVPVCDRCS